MGGVEGSRGYLLQSMVSLLESMQDAEWDEVNLEPNTKEDKVDVIWYKNSKAINAAQIKSSINPFSKKNISDWIIKLANDVESEKYSLILLGGFEDGVMKFIRGINENGTFTNEEKQLVESYVTKIQDGSLKVRLINFDGDVTETSDIFARVKNAIQNFLPPELELSQRHILSITKEFIAEFALLSTRSMKVTREYIENQMRLTIQKEIKRYKKRQRVFEINIDVGNIDRFSIQLEDAMKHEEVQNSWHDDDFKRKLKTVLEELALNAFTYGSATNCEFSLFRKKIVMEDDGIKFNLVTDIPAQASQGFGAGTEVLRVFLEKYDERLAIYKHEYDELAKKNIVTIEIINTDGFDCSINGECQIITQGTFIPFRTQKLEPIDVPDHCEEVIFKVDNWVMSTGYLQAIQVVKQALPKSKKMVAFINNNHDHFEYLLRRFEELGIIVNISE